MKRRTENAFSVARRRACMERPARRRSSPMELAKRPNPLTQQQCDPFSKHGLWRCDCTESEQKPPKPLFCVQWISMTVAPGERTTAGLGCSPGCGPTVRVADPEVADPAHAQRGMPRVRHKRGVFFRPSAYPSNGTSQCCLKVRPVGSACARHRAPPRYTKCACGRILTDHRSHTGSSTPAHHRSRLSDSVKNGKALRTMHNAALPAR